ncbi:MAG: hypothetical protein GX946_08260 [Oligosphaeraceae bacterium]|nr:hypothetical protein [Oligosphaeraceae bacterium]
MSVDKKNFFLILLLAGNMIFFAGTFYFMQDNQSLQKQLSDLNASREKLLGEVETLRIENKRLQSQTQTETGEDRTKQQQIENLERLLEQREEEIAALISRLPDQGATSHDARRLQREDETQNHRGRRFQQARQEQRERMRIWREEQSAKREYFFKNLDVSKMSAEQRRQINRYQELLNEMENDFIAAGEGGQRPNFEAIMQRSAEISELSISVQETLLQNLGRQLGVSEESFSSSVNEILDLTTSRGAAAFAGAFSLGFMRRPPDESMRGRRADERPR